MQDKSEDVSKEILFNHLRINVRRLLRCCDRALQESSSSTAQLDRQLLQTYLEDARAIIAELVKDRPSDLAQELLQEVKRLEPYAQKPSSTELRQQLLIAPASSKARLELAGLIPPVTASEAAELEHRVLHSASSHSFASNNSSERVRERTDGTPMTSFRSRTNFEENAPMKAASETDIVDNEVITELTDLVNTFKSKALNMGEALKMDVKAIEDTETLMQKNFSKLFTSNTLIKLQVASEWRQTILFCFVLVVSTFLFFFVIFIILWYRVR